MFWETDLCLSLLGHRTCTTRCTIAVRFVQFRKTKNKKLINNKHYKYLVKKGELKLTFVSSGNAAETW